MMSGTSLDAIDLALAQISAVDLPVSGRGESGYEVHLLPVADEEVPWPAGVRAELVAASTGRVVAGPDRWCLWHAQVGRIVGEACAQAIARWGPVDLIVCHGQTLAHVVVDGRVSGSLQVGSPAHVYAATGVPVVSDLRSADVAAGGQGAPLASMFDALWLGDRPSAAVNLGGIANVTLIDAAGAVVTGDTGPANCLLDSAAAELGESCDREGRWAAAGVVDRVALGRLLADPYYARPFPKSTGRDHFHCRYVRDLLGGQVLSGPDLFATLTELSARTVADALGSVDRVVVSGGGAANPTLMRRLRELAGAPVTTSDALGVPSSAKEALLMALLGWLSVHGVPGVAVGPGGPVTGACRPAVLGSSTPPCRMDLPGRWAGRRPRRLVVGVRGGRSGGGQR
ncbi:anhydro-N-acetylmuramic acid kinase [Austwickia chelonae]|uniref:anhydro-N-acetylmuramic acid kinase n=1 Tax=Austwickia chelonae TaxID=100225 RepID=UPI0008CE09A8|nr:anhydro-N-acetylmuramic acid kinase [Austwickia chelonae]SEW37905.1 anhydro-N-acetylmuramic acid kinase [Austwickia chelonae]